jgi:transposase
VGIGAPKDISACRRFFLEPGPPRQRQYEALRAYFVEGRPTREIARAFGFSPGSFHVLCQHFRRDPAPVFFVAPRRGPRAQPKKAAARDLIVRLRKQNASVYEISATLKERRCPLSPTAVRAVLKAEGFAPLPRRLDAERPGYPRPTIEPVADVREFSLAPRRLTTRCGGLFLFVPDLVRLELEQLATRARLPGSRLIPGAQALRACLALKLWSLERKSHSMALVADPGLALFAGLNAIPKKSYYAEYSSRITPTKTTQVLAAWHEQVSGAALFPGQSFNLDFHSVPYAGEHPVVERHIQPQAVAGESEPGHDPPHRPAMHDVERRRVDGVEGRAVRDRPHEQRVAVGAHLSRGSDAAQGSELHRLRANDLQAARVHHGDESLDRIHDVQEPPIRGRGHGLRVRRLSP